MSENPRFGKYTLRSKLGAGGMAEVFKAHIASNENALVAIKRILPQFSEHRELVNMLIREASLSVGLIHPNIVPILDFGAVDETYFLAMEYIHGKDLKSVMIRLSTRKAAFPIPLAVHAMTQVLRGLDYAHHKCDKYGQPLQLVHRDISPQNVMISFSGQIKVLDFGIAKATARSTDTQTGVLKGKFSYMSPEQALGEPVDPRTDVFSAGIVMWELLTLKHCFEGESDLELLENVRAARVRNPSSVNPAIPPELSEIILKALQKKPKKRFATAGEFADVLEKYQEERFGKLRDADTAVFLRSLYDVAAHEVEVSTPAAHLSEKGFREVTPVGVHRAPWVRKTPSWVKQAPLHFLVLAGVTFFFWVFPPMGLFLQFDRAVIDLASKAHQWHQQKEMVPTQPSESSPETTASSFYTVSISDEAQQVLGDLSFETFDRTREFINDLAARPMPKGATSISSRPGAFSAKIAGLRVVYLISDIPRTIRVEKVRRLR